MFATATLTNCYVPLIESSPTSSSSTFDAHNRHSAGDADDEAHSALSDDDDCAKYSIGAKVKNTPKPRGPRTLRQLHLSRSILTQSTGSSLLELGHTKLLCSVRGPRPLSNLTNGSSSSSHAMDPSKGSLYCEVRYMPQVGVRVGTMVHSSFVSMDRSSRLTASGSGGTRIPKDTLFTAGDASLYYSGGSLCAPAAFMDEMWLSQRLWEALSPAVILDGLERCSVDVFVNVLQSDGAVLGSAISAATLALVDAGVKMKDVVCGGSAAVVPLKDNKYCVIADPTEEEILQASGVVTIAMMPNWREVTVWDQFGKMSSESSAEAMDSARDGCVTMHKFLRNCLIDTNEVA